MRVIQSEGAAVGAGDKTITQRFRSMAVAGRSSVVTVGPGGDRGHDLVLPAAPDAALARRVTAGLHHLVWVRIDVSTTESWSEVLGTTRRPHRPHRQRLPLAAALALADAGVPAMVRHRRAGA